MRNRKPFQLTSHEYTRTRTHRKHIPFSTHHHHHPQHTHTHTRTHMHARKHIEFHDVARNRLESVSPTFARLCCVLISRRAPGPTTAHETRNMLLKRPVSRGTSEAETFGLPSQSSSTATSTILEQFRGLWISVLSSSLSTRFQAMLALWTQHAR